MKGIVLSVAAGLLLSTPVLACPQFPKHKNMHDAAQDFCAAAEKIKAAQKANKDELGGHAEAALKHLEQAMHELEEAAVFANAKKK